MKTIDAIDLSTTEIEFLLAEWVHNKLYRDICRDKFLDGYTYEKVAEIYDMSPRQIKRIVFDCKRKMVNHVKDSVFRIAIFNL